MSQATQELAATLQKDRGEELQRCQASLHEKHQAELNQMEAALSREQQRHKALVDELSARHELDSAAVRQQTQHDLEVLQRQYADALASVTQQHNDSLWASEAAAERRLQSLLAQVMCATTYLQHLSCHAPCDMRAIDTGVFTEVPRVNSQAQETHACELTALTSRHDGQLTTLRDMSERHIQDTIARWQQQSCVEREAAHAAKTDELAQLCRSHAAAMADCQAQHSQEVVVFCNTLTIWCQGWCNGGSLPKTQCI